MNLFNTFVEKISPRETIYIRGQNKQIEKLIIAAHSKGFKTKDLLRILTVNNATFQSWRIQGIPISKIKEINSLSLEIIGEPIINESNVLIGLERSHHSILIPQLNEELCYLVGYLSGDGSLLQSNKGDLRLEFDDISKNFLNYISILVSKLFNVKPAKPIKDKLYNCYCLRFNSKLVVLFFNRIFEIPIGKKKGKLHIPKIIKESKFIKEFIEGFFDAEGHIYYNPKFRYYHLVLTQRDRKFLEEIRNILKLFDIPVTRITNDKIVITRKQNIMKFISIFNLRHPDKTSRIKLMLEGKSTVRNSRI